MCRYGVIHDSRLHDLCKKVGRERRIPFEVSADPFYSESNMKHLEKIAAEINAGTAKLVEHDLIEEE